MNGDVILKKKNHILSNMAFTSGKLEQLRMIVDNLPKDIWTVSLTASAIPYALEKGEIDGAVIDYSKFLKLKGNYEIIPFSNNYITYVFVIKKDLINSAIFKNFLKSYNQVVLEKNSKIDKEKEILKWKPIYIPLEL